MFDKTGTLTADTQTLVSILHPPIELHTQKNASTRDNKKPLSIPFKSMSNVVLAGGHTLVGYDGINSTIIGDPLDMASLSYTRWKYDAHEKCAESNEQPTVENEPAKLWQIRSFPFDPNKKLSSAVLLVRNHDGNFRLWVVAKGAPDKMRSILFKNDGINELAQWYDSSIQRLGTLGHRSISLGAMDVTDTGAAHLLFPSGLPNHNDSRSTLDDLIHKARSLARATVHRNDIEQHSAVILDRKEMVFVGFACFNAPMRESTPRVVRELKNAKVEVRMLTGDETYTSLAIADKAGIIKYEPNMSTYLLKVNSPGSLVWEVNKKLKEFSLPTAKKAQSDIKNGKGVLIVSGNAIKNLLSIEQLDPIAQYVCAHLLSQTSLITSASPRDKYEYIRWLQRSCKKCVLMCGMCDQPNLES